MKHIYIRTCSVLAFSVILLASCQKAEAPIEENKDVVVIPAEAPGTLVSATKLSTVSVTEMTETLIPTLKDSKAIFSLKLIGKKLVDFNIVTYKIRYWSKTVVAGKDTSIVLSGNIAYIVDQTGNFNRHLESVTLYNSFFNTSSEDISLGERNSYYYLRAIFNALVVFPLYQGGDPEEKNNLFVPSSEFVIKAKQAIDCERAALEFIKQQEGVEMLPGYYTEIIGISNGGGPALACHYLLENDPEYSAYNEQVNLLSTYIGSGNCSSTSLISTIMHIDQNSIMKYLSTAGYIPTVVGTYLTWGDKYFKGIDVMNYFAEPVRNTRFPQYKNQNAIEFYSTNSGSVMYASGELPPITETINPALLNEAKTDVDLDNPEFAALCKAFQENEIICNGWTPKHALKIVHSTDDDFLFYDNVYKFYENLSDNGRNLLVRFDTMTGKTHIVAAFQSMLNVILCKHPYYSGTIINIEDIADQFGDLSSWIQ